VEGLEECDDGNAADGDACLSNCVKARCGDGFIRQGTETCDDGNPWSGDGCSPSCRLEVAALGAGRYSTCAVSVTSQLKCWGRNDSGELGLGDTFTRGDQPGEMGENLPQVQLGRGADVQSVTGGASHGCAILLGDALKCWGYNGDGELGLGDAVWRGFGPNQMGDSLPQVDLGTYLGAAREPWSVSAGFSFTCDVDAVRGAKCWGANLSGQLGQGDTLFRGDGPMEMGDSLLPIDFGTSAQARTISAGADHACVLLEGGTVKCWGGNQSGQLGLGDTVARGNLPNQMGDYLPAVNLGTGVSAFAVAVARERSCAILVGGRLKCWGTNHLGELGLEDSVNRGWGPEDMGDNLPVVNLGTQHSVTSVALGESHTCALLDDGVVKCWGANPDGELGTGNTVSRGSAAGDMGDHLPAVDLGQPAQSIVAGAYHTCALLQDRTVKCWGANPTGQLGLGDTDSRGDDPDEMGDKLPAVDLGF
jgi:cysteine-rich repeat protein